MRVDLHNHTTLCHHASGSMEEYVLKAISEGINVFGFSCHNPMGFDPKYRMSKEDLPFYLEQIKQLKEKYSDKIEILSALEIDYLPPFMEEYLFELPLDYCIGAVHFLGTWGFDNPEFIREYAKRDINMCWIEYFKATQELAKTQKFQILAHMDLLKVFNHRPTKDIRKEILSALKEVKKANMCVEINASGLRKEVQEQYPSRDILEMCYELEIPITFGSDAHSIEHINFSGNEIRNLAKEIGYTKCALYRNKERVMVEF